jgi:hypothetical protein
MSAEGVNPPDKRMAQWNLKFDPERIKVITEQGKATWQAHAEAKFTDIYEMEVSVKQEMSRFPVSVALVPMYLCFGREMWKASKHHTGEILSREASVKIAKWVARDLNEEVLTQVCTQVFNVRPA